MAVAGASRRGDACLPVFLEDRGQVPALQLAEAAHDDAHAVAPHVVHEAQRVVPLHLPDHQTTDIKGGWAMKRQVRCDAHVEDLLEGHFHVFF